MMTRRDDEVFREFVAAGSAALLRLAYLLVGDAGLAEDLLQTALVKTYLAWGRIRDPGAVHAYARRALVTSATSWWRRRSSREEPVEAVPDPVFTGPDLAAQQADRAVVRQLLLTLPAKQRAVLVLRFYEDLTEAEVAETLGVTRGTVTKYTARALATLRLRLAEEEVIR